MIKSFIAAFSLLLLLISGCSTAPSHPTLQKASLPELIPVRDFTANLDANYNYKISPDGKTISWLAVQGTLLRIHYRSVDSDEVKVIRDPNRRPVNIYAWGQDSKTIYYLRDAEGNENYHIYRTHINRPNAAPVNLTPMPGVRVGISGIPRHDPDHILITHNQRDPSVFDLYRLSPKTGKSTLIAQNPGDVLHWLTDDHGKLHARYRKTEDFSKVLEVLNNDGKSWRRIASWGFDAISYANGFTADKKSLWAVSNKNRNFSALVKINLKTGQGDCRSH